MDPDSEEEAPPPEEMKLKMKHLAAVPKSPVSPGRMPLPMPVPPISPLPPLKLTKVKRKKYDDVFKDLQPRPWLPTFLAAFLGLCVIGLVYVYWPFETQVWDDDNELSSLEECSPSEQLGYFRDQCRDPHLPPLTWHQKIKLRRRRNHDPVDVVYTVCFIYMTHCLLFSAHIHRVFFMYECD
jgi:hypothetical protein